MKITARTGCPTPSCTTVPVVRRSLLVISAVLLAAIGTALVYLYARAADDRALAGQNPVTVVVAGGRFDANTPATKVAADVTTVMVPESATAPGALRSAEELRLLGSRVLQVAVLPGTQLTAPMFADKAPSAAGKDRVLVSVKISPAGHVGNLLKAGNDVAVYSRNPTGRMQQMLSPVHVFAINGDLVTFEVRPGEVQQLLGAQDSLWLALLGS